MTMKIFVTALNALAAAIRRRKVRAELVCRTFGLRRQEGFDYITPLPNGALPMAQRRMRTTPEE